MLAALGAPVPAAAQDSATALMRHLFAEYCDLAAYPAPPQSTHTPHCVQLTRRSGASIITVVAEKDGYIDGLRQHVRNVGGWAAQLHMTSADLAWRRGPPRPGRPRQRIRPTAPPLPHRRRRRLCASWRLALYCFHPPSHTVYWWVKGFQLPWIDGVRVSVHLRKARTCRQ